MTDHFVSVGAQAEFAADKATKADLARGDHLFAGLNCFEPGQGQRVHAHAASDKFYFVVSGQARLAVGDETRLCGPGTLVWAPAGVPHGVVEVLERAIMLVAMAPGPGSR